MEDDSDRRIRRTRRALEAALIELTSERPYQSIQVRDISDRADVGYATFYRHYESKDDLMLAVFNRITNELEASAGEEGEGYFVHEGSLLFAHVQKYEGLYRSILQSHKFVPRLKKLIAQQVETHIRRHAHRLGDPALPTEVAANHMVVSLVGLIEWWLDNHMSLPVEKMARIYDRLVIRATWYALQAGNRLPLPWHT
jgi:AcrR family transcriptional regulator